MLLVGVKEENGWLLSRWNLTYKVGWNHICKAVHSVYEYYNRPEVLVDGNIVEIKNKDEIFCLEERGSMVIRGNSEIIKIPLMITFYNQIQAVDVSVAGITDEFKNADYQQFNMSLGQYMDSIELAMYR